MKDNTVPALYVTTDDVSTLWDLVTGKPIGRLTSGVARFSSDGKRLAIGTKDDLTIWDANAHQVGASITSRLPASSCKTVA